MALEFFWLLECPKSGTLTPPNADENQEQQELAYIAGGNVIWYSYLGRQFGSILHDKTYSFLKKILFIFKEKGREGEREGEKHQCVVTSFEPYPGDLACNPGMCPDWELNQ